jgi:RHS repeat-associated protein
MTTAAICASREFAWSPSFYRGEQYDSDLGLYYLRARYYNPNTGRFLSRDPEDGYIDIPATLHKYLYVGGDPVNWIDPKGRELVEVELEDEKSIEETEVYAKKFECVDDAYEQLADLEFRLSYYSKGYGGSSGKSLQALFNCAKKGL